MQLINPSTSPNKLNTTLTPHSIMHGDACFAYFNKNWDIPTISVSCDYAASSYAARDDEHPGSREMKWFVAAISLICLSSTVLAHDNYSGFRDRNGSTHGKG